MRSKLVRFQLVFFAVVGTLAVLWCGYAYAGWQRYTGIGTYTVNVHLERGGGLYPNSLVTYRGVDVGVVTAIDAVPSGAVAKLQIESSFSIPASSKAFVRSVSVAGEQFIDLVPKGDGDKAVLHNGSSIAQSDTEVPVPAEVVIQKAHGLLTTVPQESLGTVLEEANTAVDRTGESLNRALAASTNLMTLASASLAPTTALVEGLNPVLGAVAVSGSDISTIATNLESFTKQLTMSDESVRTLLDTGTPFLDATSRLMQELKPTVPTLLANLQSTGEVLRVNVPGLRHILVVYPAMASAINADLAGFQGPGSDPRQGQGALDVKLGNTQNPPPCSSGYQNIQRRDPRDTTEAPMPTGQYCQRSKDSVRLARGIANLPCATDPSVRSALVTGCPGGAPSTWRQMLSRPGVGYQGPVPNSPNSQAVTAVPYDPATGQFRVPGRTETYTVGSVTSKVPGKANEKELKTWQELFPH
ncbi:MCE family protein [Tsukamurella paurometabola]|uniref:MCE family protein n=1 Tax=Tsukamurella paurometabola TaxID=2061 RepID=A0ABS5NFB7_TSUPA|nr:MlaD family protein [Tsukamurella paurometabola]MBS4102991.1 MCE family protein [Tsukamurella paurometabola]